MNPLDTVPMVWLLVILVFDLVWLVALVGAMVLTDTESRP